jgi:multiple sugar transport system ATP-binding protein
MKLGVIQQVGTPQEIYGEPANLFVAGFIGTPSMNFLDCSLHAENGEFRLRNDQFTLTLSPGIANKAQIISAESRLVMGIRPEHIRLSPQEQPDAIPMEVEVVEPQSSEYVVGLRLGEHLLKAKQDRRSMGFRPQVGQKVWANFLQTKVHLFDKDSEVRLT